MAQPAFVNVKSRLTGRELAVIELLYQLAQSTARKVRSGARYCFPSEKWIGQRLGMSRETVSHIVTRLSRLGILQVIHRRKKDGHWQSNLYKVINCVSWWRYRLRAIFEPLDHRVKESSHIENPKKEIIEVSEGPPVSGSVSGVLADTIRELEAKAPAFSLVK